MIKYVGNLDFREVPGSTGPTQQEVGLDTLVRTFRGKTAFKYVFFSVTLGSPDKVFPQLYATNVEPVDLEGGITEFRVTYKGMLSGQPRDPHVADAIVIKSGTVNAQYVYERMETWDGQFYYQTFLGDPIPSLVNVYKERTVDIQASVSYYARSTTYNYVRRERPTGPQFESSGVNGFSQPITMFNAQPSGGVQTPRFPTITHAIAVPTVPGETALDNPEYQRFLNDVAEINTAPMKFKRLSVSQSDKTIICSNFTAEREGVWWVCSETWEVELKTQIAAPTSSE